MSQTVQNFFVSACVLEGACICFVLLAWLYACLYGRRVTWDLLEFFCLLVCFCTLLCVLCTGIARYTQVSEPSLGPWHVTTGRSRTNRMAAAPSHPFGFTLLLGSCCSRRIWIECSCRTLLQCWSDCYCRGCNFLLRCCVCLVSAIAPSGLLNLKTGTFQHAL
jgi:hypothetical protein